jgi:protein SCO1/2
MKRQRMLALMGMVVLVLVSARSPQAAAGPSPVGPPQARATTVGPVTVQRAWSRATPPGTTVGVAYFDIINSGAADELIGMESAVAQRVEMHATSMAGGMMQMRQAQSVAIPAAGRVAFSPSGLHAMLLQLKQPLKEGELVPLTLMFRHAGRVQVMAVVQGLDAEAAPAAPAAASPPAAALTAPTAAAVPQVASPPYRLTVWPPRAQSPDFKLVDARGRARTLADYRGRVVVLFFGFVHCPDVCPAELYRLSAAMKQLGPLADRVQVLFVTLDPARDTPKLLNDYVKAFDARFVGLTGTAPQIDAAAKQFFVEFARVGTGADYTLDHSTATFLLDANGRLRLVGAMNTSIDNYAHDLAALAME